VVKGLASAAVFTVKPSSLVASAGVLGEAGRSRSPLHGATIGATFAHVAE
jgi:hypothetical protein